MTRHLPFVAWLLMAGAALGVFMASLNAWGTLPAPSADANARTIVVPVRGTPTLMIVLMASYTPGPTRTPMPPTLTPSPTDTPWPICPQEIGSCQWPWPTETLIPAETTTPYPICSTPVPGLRCTVASPIGGD